MSRLIMKHAAVSLQFINYSYRSVRIIIVVGINREFSALDSKHFVPWDRLRQGRQEVPRLCPRGATGSGHDQSVPAWLPWLSATQTPHTSRTRASTEPLTPSSLANQTWVVTAWLHFPFQQQIHHHLCQVAACSSLSQGGSVVKGSHVILRRKRGSKALYLGAYRERTSKITVSLAGKSIYRMISSWKTGASWAQLSFSWGVFSAYETQTDVLGPLLFVGKFYLLGEPLCGWPQILNREPRMEGVSHSTTEPALYPAPSHNLTWCLLGSTASLR